MNVIFEYDGCDMESQEVDTMLEAFCVADKIAKEQNCSLSDITMRFENS